MWFYHDADQASRLQASYSWQELGFHKSARLVRDGAHSLDLWSASPGDERVDFAAFRVKGIDHARENLPR